MEKQQNSLLNAKLSATAFAVMMIVYIFTSFLGQWVILSFAEAESAVYILFGGIFAPLSIIIVVFSLKSKTKMPILEMTAFRKFNIKYLFYAVLLAVGMFFGLGFVNTLISKLALKIGLNVGGITPPIGSALEYILSCVVYALLPALCEEVMFRGIMGSGLKKAGVLGCSLVSALCFALYHGSITQLVYQFAYGFLICLLFISSKSVIPSIIAHFLNNFAIITLYFMGIDVDLFNGYFIALGMVCLAVFSVLMIIDKNLKKEEKEKGVAKEFILPFGVFPIIICSLLIILSAVA